MDSATSLDEPLMRRNFRAQLSQLFDYCFGWLFFFLIFFLLLFVFPLLMLTAYFKHERLVRRSEMILYGFFSTIAVHLHLDAIICFACLRLALAASYWTKSKMLHKIIGVHGIALVASFVTSFFVALFWEAYLLMFSGPSKERYGMLYLVCYLNIAFFGSFGIAFTIVQGKIVCQRLIEEGRALPWHFFSGIVSNILAAVVLTASTAVDLFVTDRLGKLAIIICSIISIHDAILNPNRSSRQHTEASLNNFAVSCYTVIAIVALIIFFIFLRRRPCRPEFLRMYYQALDTLNTSAFVIYYSVGSIFLSSCGLIILIMKCPPNFRLIVCGTFFLAVLLAWKYSGFNLMRALFDLELKFLGPPEVPLLPAQPSLLTPTKSVALLIDGGCESQSTDGCDVAQMEEITTHIKHC